MSEERLISKKDVLEKLRISYGQLYRWKRKGLIPEDWFIRQSTFTGQETFFPADKIIARIERIKEMKENLPLDELANLITSQVNEKLEVAFSRLRNLGWLDEQVVKICHINCGKEADKQTLPLADTLCVGVLSKLEKTARSEEIDLAKQTLDRAISKGLMERVRSERLFLYLLRKRLAAAGISAEISLVIISQEGAMFDPGIEVVQSVDLQGVLETIKLDFGHQDGSAGNARRSREEQEPSENG